MKSVLNESVLVLNRLWQAVNICTARRALCLLCQGHAHVVHASGEDFVTLDFDGWRDFSVRYPDGEAAVHTVSLRIRVPKVILLVFFDRLPRKEIKLTRHNIFERDRHQCQYCGRNLSRQEMNLDHIIPRDRGGLTVWENLACSCIGCNTRKGNRTPREASMKLLRHPRRPKWRPFVIISHARLQNEHWRYFLDPSLWDVEFGNDISSR